MSSVIILGDVHLGKGVSLGKAVVGANLNSRVADQVKLLEWTLEQAVVHHSSHIIVTGDIFEDPKPHPALLTLFVAWLKQCHAHNVNVHIIMGNHDILRSGYIYTSPLDVISEVELENVHIYREVDTVLIGRTAFTMVPFRDRKSFSVASNADAVSIVRNSLVYELASIPATYQKVLVGHLAIEGSIWVGDEFDDLANELFCPLDMFQGYDHVWMGHVHKPQVLQKSPHVAHIGSMDISNFGETEQKKFIVIYDTYGAGSWTTENLPVRPLRKLSVTVPKDTEDPTDYVLKELEKAGSWDRSIARVDVSLAAPDAKSINKTAIEQYLSSHGAFNVTGISESKKVSLIKKDTNNTMDTKMDVATSINTYAEKYIDKKKQASFIELATDILKQYKLEAKDSDTSLIGGDVSGGMKPLRLYLKDFMCYDWAYIDFTQFSSALIVGKTEGNDAEANGVGKTTIFKSIEYVLFNQSNFNLEKIIRDEALVCQVVFDFVIGDKEYRLLRKRSRKGSTDLSLYERTGEAGTEEEALHTSIYSPLFTEKYWKDISGRRAADTEKDLGKLLKINYKSFRTFVHFVQNDFYSLATATPEKRKQILKDALNLVVYTKLEKIAKDKSASLSRELDRVRVLLEALGDPDEEIHKLEVQLTKTDDELTARQMSLQDFQEKLQVITEGVNVLTTQHSALEGKFSSLVSQEQALSQSKSKTEISIKEYTTKKSNVSQDGRDLLNEIRQLEKTQEQLATLDYSQLDIMAEQIEQKKVLVTQNSVVIQNSMTEYDELKIPMPTDSVCKHCRQPMTEQHRKECLTKDRARMTLLQANIKEARALVGRLNMEIQANQQTISQLILSRQHLEGVNTKIANKKKEMADKRAIYEEYRALLEKFTNELKDKEQELVRIREELKNSSIDEAKVLQVSIRAEKDKIANVNSQISAINKEITHFTNQKAIVQHSVDQKKIDRQKKIDLSKMILELEDKLGMYPLVIQAFSSTGIPNLIIHNILDELQLKVNTLLSQFKPGLQLFFFVEKTNGDGEETDTLDITYQINGKDRYYEQLPGGFQLMILFSLRLGMSFLLQNLLGIDIKFLLLDELDQSLSRGRVDAFADIIKILQKEFTILVITHNDRLKDKFSHAVLVEQDINMVSRAQVVSSW
jgi:DNA repair exonuclease SbcCD ATPase subunit/DNA repair exonuclease SbcCD nuclease subunit